MKRDYFNKWLQQIEATEVNLDSSITLLESEERLSELRMSLETVTTEALAAGFANQEEEIFFFKTLKPTLLARWWFYERLNEILYFAPESPQGDVFKQYFSEALMKAEKERFEVLEHYKELLMYYRCGKTDKDAMYFTGLQVEAQEGEGSDVIIARFECSRLLCLYLADQIYSASTEKKSGLSWTAKKNALVELCYALYASDVINKGEVSIGEIVRTLGSVFGVKIEGYYHAFHKAKMRDKDTTFIDKLKEKYDEYVSDSFK